MIATEIIYAIREKLKAYTDDTRYTDSYLYFLINIKRALYIRREYNQIQKVIDPEVLQTVCIPLEEVSDSLCPTCPGVAANPQCTDDCTIIRTSLKLPKTIELHSRNTIVKISPAGTFDRPFSFISMDRLPYVGESKYEKNIIYAAIHSDGHFYFRSNSSSIRNLDKVLITALFENPDDVSAFKCPTTGVDGNLVASCFNLEEDEYPIKSWMTDIVISEIVNELANLKQIPADTKNDARQTPE